MPWVASRNGAGRIPANGAVVYVAYEGARRFRRRLAALKHQHGKSAPVYLVQPPKVSIYRPAGVKR